MAYNNDLPKPEEEQQDLCEQVQRRHPRVEDIGVLEEPGGTHAETVQRNADEPQPVLADRQGDEEGSLFRV